MAKPLESTIETYFKNQIKRIGGLSYKFLSSVNGVPDQIAIFNGGVYFVELKRPGGKPRTQQRVVHEKIQEQGVTVHVVDSKEHVDAFIRDVLGVDVATIKKEPTHDSTLREQKAISGIDLFSI